MSAALFSLLIRNEQDVVTARQRARQVADLLGFDRQDGIRIATAVSEIARNAFRYAGGGRVDFSFIREAPAGIEIVVSDSGRGIVNVQQVLDGTSEKGRGIVGCRRLMDEFEIQSVFGRGTRVRLVKNWREGHRVPSITALEEVSKELRRQPVRDPLQELQRQNHDLLNALEESQRNRDQLGRLNRELDDTNRGVMALYAELDDRADSLRRASEAKTRFLSGMTHELRSPLNSILSLSRMLAERMDGDLTPEQAKQVSYIQKAATSLSDLVNDLLDIAKVEAGKLTVRIAEFTVGDLLGSLRGTTRPLLTRPQEVALIFEENAQEVRLRTDEGRLAQVLRNLISNAIKFTERGEVRVGARLVSGHEICFTVADTGIGIDPADQERIFEEFTQIESPLQRNLKGTGLGLSLAKKLTELLGGSLALSSEKGKGSIFSLTLPLIYSGDAESISPFAVGAAGASVTKPIHARPLVLVADDDEISRYLVRSVLESEGCEVMEAPNGERGLALAQNRNLSLIILDMVMPGLSGLSVIERLRENSSTQGLPAILHTAAALTPFELSLANSHRAIYVPKKYDDRTLWEAQLRDAVTRSGIHLSTTAR